MRYFFNILLACDQLGNAICGGNPDNTISARVGYFAEINNNASKYYWKTIEKIINFTFWTVNGPDHCKQAFEADPQETFNDNNGDFFRVLLCLILAAFCVPIAAILYSIWIVKESIKIIRGI